MRVDLLAKLSTLGMVLLCSPAAAQNNSLIADFRKDLFSSCYAGDDIGAMTKTGNPLRLLGTLAYIGPVLKPDGTVGTGLVSEKMVLPITVAEAIDPANTTCSLQFETVTDGGISFLGIGVAAAKSDVYKVEVRLLSQQAVSSVVEGDKPVQAWRSVTYAPQFRAVVASLPSTVTDFFMFDNISVYLVQVERYQKTGGNIGAGIGLFSGAARYKRDINFNSTRLLVTGKPVSLTRASFGLTNAAIQAPASGPDVVSVLSAPEVTAVSQSLRQQAVPPQ